MIKISREDAMMIRNELPWAHVTITNKRASSRKKSYYVEETRSVLKLLDEIHLAQKSEHFE